MVIGYSLIVGFVITKSQKIKVARWPCMLVRWTTDQAVRVQTLAGDIEFFGETLYSHSASLHPGVQLGTGEFNIGDNLVMD